MFMVYYHHRWLFDIPASEALVFKEEGWPTWRQNEAFKIKTLGLD